MECRTFFFPISAIHFEPRANSHEGELEKFTLWMSLSFSQAAALTALCVLTMRKLLESDKKESTDADDVDKAE